MPWNRGEQGVTLLEVLVALGIVSIVLVAVFRLHTQAITMERVARFHTLAPLQAPDYPSTDSGNFGDDHPGYSWSVETRDVDTLTDSAGGALLKQIDIQVHLNSEEDLFTLRRYRLVHIGP